MSRPENLARPREPIRFDPMNQQLEGGAYEIIRGRLAAHADDLRSRLDRLNASRKGVFGSIETVLRTTERITTANVCAPRDMQEIGANRFLFGYNVHIGLKSETAVADVFACYEFRDGAFHEQPLDALASSEFHTDFRDLYRYYKGTVFAKFSMIGPHLFMVFQVGRTAADIKTFKWLVRGGALTYLGNRSDHEFAFPPQIEFEWKRTHRDLHRAGRHPHISIEDRVFVETIHGDLTIKIEDNTDTGLGIYSEPVENKDQTLDDAEVFYASVGHLVLLRIRPYKETIFRHFVFNEKLKEVRRLDALGGPCVLLPTGHGLIFANGYYLQSGEFRTFPLTNHAMLFERRVAAPNGEDHLYVFYHRESGAHVLMFYNVIAQKVENPITCNGFSLFENGELAVFQTQSEPQRHHSVQIWQTPFTASESTLAVPADSFLGKIGNRDIVRAMAECQELLAVLQKDDTYADLYLDLAKRTGAILDSYFWLDHDEAGNLREPLAELRRSAQAAIGEFEKVVQLRKSTAEQVAAVTQRAEAALGAVGRDRMDSIETFVRHLAAIRTLRGEIIALKELRYSDLASIDHLEKQVLETTNNLSRACVEFFLSPDALHPYQQKVRTLHESVPKLATVVDANHVGEELATVSSELEMLVEVVNTLKIDDATQNTRILDDISSLYAVLNQVRAAIGNRKRDLVAVEGAAQFGAGLRLLDQAVLNYLELCNSPQKCDEFLGRAMAQLEELEARFTDFDLFLDKINENRSGLYNAFETRKLALVEARNQRTVALAAAADRTLKGIQHRAGTFTDLTAIHGYFTSDLMVARVRETINQLLDLQDPIKADDIQSRLKTIREDAIRQLKDKQELFVDGKEVIRFGKHRFTVNTQELELTTVLRDDDIFLHLTGTNFFEKITDPELLAVRDRWEQKLISETAQVYRGEYLAYLMFEQQADFSEEEIQRFMAPRYGEGYVKGVHDHDAARILAALMEMRREIGLLRFDTRARALAAVFWELLADGEDKQLLVARLRGLGLMRGFFKNGLEPQPYIAELRQRLVDFCERTGLFSEEWIDEAADYLFHELQTGAAFSVSNEAADQRIRFLQYLASGNGAAAFESARKAVASDPASEYRLVRDWVRGFAATDCSDETAWLVFRDGCAPSQIVTAPISVILDGMRGEHALIRQGVYSLNYVEFMRKLRHHSAVVVPQFERFATLKKRLIENAREEMRLEEFRPRVLTSFVRNRLIDSVFLPLVGDSLAKQIGVIGEGKRTDLMGMLLLISPPGYGKTTLVEYVANRLGLVFMKINGPAIGDRVISLDPAEAPNASAREEMEKLSLALEMGDNVMLCIDDIQHLNPQFLQKFISLCDAQRKIEGVYKGRPRTYDFRGRKVAVVMAGNPYTESGEKFKIPDMLANRADTHNLGDLVGGMAEAFRTSFLENALTSNPVLGKLASRSQKDIYSIIRIAETGSREGVDFEANYTPEEISESVNVMSKLIRIRDVVLKVNAEYIRSAAQADAYRTEPPFRLQGSYRNMNRLAEKVFPILNDSELEALLHSHYRNEAQTLAVGAEANLLKFKELTGVQTTTEAARWEEIKTTFRRNLLFQNVDRSDPVGQVVAQLSQFGAGLESIQKVLREAVAKQPQTGLLRVTGDNRVMDFTEKRISRELLQKIYDLIEREDEDGAEKG